MGRVATGAGTTGRLGTFAGVFTPSILTILGIILFLRLGFVVGSAGLGPALVAIGIANLISVLTTFSLATISTNLRVKSGGDYYLISRTLGVEFGGALGVVLFAAQSVSIAFYAIGFGEAIGQVLGSETPWLPQAVAAVAVAALFVLAWFGADVATRFQFVVMAVLAASLVAFFIGGLPRMDGSLLRSNWPASPEFSFWMIFAIFFPAVTGFTQGVSMSGELRDPARSLPLGTFLAVGTSIVVYLAVAIVFAGTVSRADLTSDYGAMRRVAALPALIDAGVIAATLSSALASFLGAPRILQSLARDRVFPWLNGFAAGHGPSGNPRRAVVLSLGIALATVALGRLNVIAPVVSMFFLISYGLLNFATYYEARAQSPSFRPTFRWYHPYLSLAGALGCGGVMLAIDPLAGAVAGAILLGILQYVRRTVRIARWADSGRSASLQQIRENLLSLSSELEHPRDWRPVILAVSGEPKWRTGLLRFASWIEGRSGFVTLVRLFEEGRGIGATVRSLEESDRELRQEIAAIGAEAFARTVPAPGGGSALLTVLGAHGVGELRANTLLLQGREAVAIDAGGPRGLGLHLAPALRAGCHLVLLDAEPEELDVLDATPVDRRRIDVWYRDDATGHLSLLLAYLTTRTPDWEDAGIRLVASRSGRRGTDAERIEELRAMLSKVRIDAEPVLADRIDPEAIERVSRDASLVLLPLTFRAGLPSGPGGQPLAECGRSLMVVAYVMAAQDLDLDADPEAGEHGEIARVLDRAEQAEATARRAVEEAEEAEAKARELVEGSRGEGGPALGEAVDQAKRARRAAEAAQRRAGEARKLADAALPSRQAPPEDRPGG